MFKKILSYFDRGPNIQFYSIIPGLEEINPPVKAGEDSSPKWIKNKSINKNVVKKIDEYNPNENEAPQLLIERCPGIRSIMNEGIHLKTWQDIKISLLSDQDGQYKIDTPTPSAALINGHFITPEVQSHNGAQFPEFTSSRKDTWPHILKIMSNWRVEMHEDWQLMLLPVYYSDESSLFSAVPGIFNPEFGNHLNINIQIHRTAPTAFLIPAGTSIVKLVPVKKKNDLNFKIRKLNKMDPIREQTNLAVLKKRFTAQRKEQITDLKKIRGSMKCPFFNSN
jgi:hypothetical protein